MATLGTDLIDVTLPSNTTSGSGYFDVTLPSNTTSGSGYFDVVKGPENSGSTVVGTLSSDSLNKLTLMDEKKRLKAIPVSMKKRTILLIYSQPFPIS